MLKPKKEMGSLKRIAAELRSLATSLKLDAENGNTRAQHELLLVEEQLAITQKQLSEQMKVIVALEKEVELFTSVMNARVDFYRQLQQISDLVAPYEKEISDRAIGLMLDQEAKFERKIASLNSKRRYLLHLKEEASNPNQRRTCVICRDNLEAAALTVCGHVFCSICIRYVRTRSLFYTPRSSDE